MKNIKKQEEISLKNMNFLNNEDDNDSLINSTQKPTGLSENINTNALALSRKKSLEIIKKEFASEKRQLKIFLSFFLMIFLVSLLLTVLFFLRKNNQLNAIEGLEFLFIRPLIVPYLFLLIVSFLLLFYFSFELFQLNKERSFYLTNDEYLAKINENRIPHFVLSAYKRMLFLQIFFNWIYIFSYFVFALTIAILVIFGDLNNEKSHNFNPIKGINLETDAIPGTKKKLIITSIILGLSLITHITIFTFAKIKQINLNVVFDIENKVANEKISSFTKKIHIISAIIILIPFVIVFLIWIIAKRILKR